MPEIEIPSRIWSRIETSVKQPQLELGPSAWWRNFFTGLRIPGFAYGFAAILLFGLVSLLAIQIFEQYEADQKAQLAELESFSVSSSENPFLEKVESQNPFWVDFPADVASEISNPFERYEEVVR
jgi:hypothetical protein